MDNGLLKKMAMMLSKVPKEDLEKNLKVAKNILANSNKDDLNKLINSKEVENILGKDKDKLQNALTNTEINNSDIDPLWKSICKIVFGLLALIISCKYFIDLSIILAKNFGLSDAVIGLTLVACGTSLPELAATLVAAFKKDTQMALGNIIGSNIFNIAFILGVCGLTSELSSPGITLVDYFMVCNAAFLVLICAKFGKITRWMGALMLISFIAYLIYLFN